VPLTVCFPDYKGTTIDDGKHFIERQFLDRSRSQDVHTHFTCALKGPEVKQVVTIIRKILCQRDNTQNTDPL